MSALRSASHLAVLCIIMLLAMTGVLFIYSAGYISSDFPVRPNWWRQCLFLAAGSAAMYFFALQNPARRNWRYLIFSAYVLSVLLLGAVLFLGREVGGAKRWLALGPFFLQPAEFAKVFTILAGAIVFSGDLLPNRRWELAAGAALFALPAGLIIAEPSYGNAVSIVPAFILMAGMRLCPAWLWRSLAAAIIILFFTGIGGLYYLRSLPPAAGGNKVETSTPSARFLRGYHLRRLKSYTSASGGWNEQQSLMTIASGGLTGKGYLRGTMKSLGYLPRTVAPTDFIFAVIAEEGGWLFGVLPVIALYTLLVWLILHWAARAPDRLCLNALAGGVALLMVHICVGIGMTIRLLPVIGLPLPLLSYGGSFTLAMMIMLGALLSCDRQTASEPSPRDADAPATLQLGPVFRLRLWRCGR